jgi:alpha-aminoadipic semialdehyde synthase
MAVDILPAELPLDASQYFSKCLLPFVEAMLKANWDKKFEKLQLPNPLKKSIILYKGQFTPDYKFMENFISD